ncbi:MAG: ATP-binding protein [Candidatus Kaelpia aquatica]|nr:ATP-binding protein [Candidatus Kaelpia aquatica]
MRIKLSSKFGIFFTILIVEIAIIAISYIHVAKHHEYYIEELQDDIEILDLAKSLERSFAQLIIPIENFNQKKSFFQQASVNIEEILDKTYRLEIDDIEGRKLLNYVTTEYAQAKKIAFEAFDIEKERPPSETEVLLKRLELNISNALMISEKFHQFVYEKIIMMRSGQERTRYFLYGIALGGLFVNILLILFSIIYFRNTITVPLVQLRNNALEVGQGRFKKTVPIKSTDEIGDLTNAFNKMIDDLRESQNQLIQAEKMASLGQLSAGVAHEIKNPLTIIIQGIEYLKNSSVDPKLIDAADRIKKAALRADKIIIDLLDYSQPAFPKFKKSDIIHLIKETLSLTKYQIDMKNIAVETSFAPEIPKVNIDDHLMKQVFLNIVMNAVDAIKDEGNLNISVDKKTIDKQSFIEIIFDDNGCGISDNNLNKVFDPFFTTKRGRKSAGLGLPVTRGIIRRHHGTIGIESSIGEGAKVRIKLPV